MTTIIELARDKGWGARVRVAVADTPEAEAAALAFFQRACAWEIGQENYHVPTVVEEATTGMGPLLEEYFYPRCEHGMSAQLCAGPGHYPMDM